MVMSGMNFRRFEPEDFDELLPMWRECFEAGVGITDPNPLTEQAKYFWTEVAPKHQIQVAYLGGQLVGFVAASAESVSQLHVRVGHHRRGIGSQLLDWAKKRSAGHLWLYTFAQNVIARAFYESQGFQATAHGFESFWKLADVRYEWTRVDAAGT
jgi:ribosomal protein S18 acetylase RimI-like enzyme